MEIIDTIKGSYIKELLKDSKRIDSRGLFEYRDIKIKSNVIPHAEGSAQVEIGSTKLLAGIKMMPAEPMEDTPDEGTLIVDAELLPLAYGEYESGPPSPESIEFARVVDRGIRAGECVNLQSLKLDDGKVWNVFADLYVLNYGGNLFDAGTLALMAALMHTNVPKYEDGKVIRGEVDKPLQVDNIVTSSTFGKLDGKLLLDPDLNEESIMSARITIANDGKAIRAIQKGLSGSFNINEVEKAIDESFKAGEKLREILKMVK